MTFPVKRLQPIGSNTERRTISAAPFGPGTN